MNVCSLDNFCSCEYLSKIFRDYEVSSFIGRQVCIIGYLTTTFASPIFNFLLILLAVQRFLLYFVDDSERYLKLSSKHWTILFAFVYFFLVTANWVNRLPKIIIIYSLEFTLNPENLLQAKNTTNDTYFPDLSISNTLDNTLMYLNFTLDVLAGLSVFLYFPMYRSIRNLAHLPSIIQSQPEKYISYQAVFISTIKLVSFFY